MNFEILGQITDIETIARGTGIRELPRLRRLYGHGSWRKLKGVARIRLVTGRVRLAELHGYEAHGIGMTKQPDAKPEFAVCINSGGYPASLESHKIYRVLPDEDAAADGDIRVIDESGEDDLYPASRFAPIRVSQIVKDSLLKVS